MNEICVAPWNLIYHLIVGYADGHVCAGQLEEPMWSGAVPLLFYLKYFFATVALEASFYFLFIKGISWRHKIIAVFVLNFATHPVIFFVFPEMAARLEWSYAHYLTAAELFAPMVEALLLRYFFQQGTRRAILTGFGANLLSWSIGALWH